MNKVVVSGRWTKEHKLIYSQSGTAILSNTIASNRKFKDSNGEIKADFINIVLFGNQAKYVADYSDKGSKVLVEGRLQSRSYNRQDGSKAYVTEVIVENVELLDSKKKEEQPKEAVIEETTTKVDAFEEFATEIEIGTDDLPF